MRNLKITSSWFFLGCLLFSQLAGALPSPSNQLRLVYGKAQPPITFCDPSRASSPSSVESFRGFSVITKCGAVSLAYADLQIDHVAPRGATSTGGSPGSTLVGAGHLMPEALVYDTRSQQLLIGGAWYKKKERGLAGFQFEESGDGITISFPGAASTFRLKFTEPNSLGYAFVREILGPEGLHVMYGGSDAEPTIRYKNWRNEMATVSYRITGREGDETILDKTLTTPSGATYQIARFKISNLQNQGTAYITDYYSAQQNLSFQFRYTDGMVSLPEAFARHQEVEPKNGQLLRAPYQISAFNGLASRGAEIPQYSVTLKRVAGLLGLVSGGTSKFIPTAEVRIGAMQLLTSSSTLKAHEERIASDGEGVGDQGAEQTNSLVGYVNWSKRIKQNQEYPTDAALHGQNFSSNENVSGAKYKYSRNEVGAITEIFRETSGGIIRLAKFDREGYWSRKSTDLNGYTTTIDGDILHPSSITHESAVGSFSRVKYSWSQYNDPRDEYLVQNLLTKISYSDNLGHSYEEEYEWDGDRLSAITFDNGQKVKKSERTLEYFSAKRSIMYNFSYENTAVRQSLAQPGVFSFESNISGATTSTTSSVAGGITQKNETTHGSNSLGYLTSSKASGSSQNAESDKNKTTAFTRFLKAVYESNGTQGNFASSAEVGEQQVCAAPQCESNGIQTTMPSCQQTIGFTTQKLTDYGGSGLGISGVRCGEKSEDGRQIIEIEYTNALMDYEARATLASLGDFTRTLNDGETTEFTNIQEVGTLECKDEFDYTGTLDNPTGPRWIQCMLPRKSSGEDKVLLIAGLNKECSPVVDEFGNPSHCAAPPFVPPPSYTGQYSNVVDLPSCEDSGDQTPIVSEDGLGGKTSDYDSPDPSGMGPGRYGAGSHSY